MKELLFSESGLIVDPFAVIGITSVALGMLDGRRMLTEIKSSYFEIWRRIG